VTKTFAFRVANLAPVERGHRRKIVLTIAVWPESECAGVNVIELAR
jgi:hypothetical protein